MKRIAILFFLGAVCLNAFSQDDNLQFKLDSILKEADLLYSYEKTVWNATDILMSRSELKNNYGGYVVSHSNDTIFVTFIEKNLKQKIAKYCFTNSNLNSPFNSEIGLSPLTNLEKELLDIKVKMLYQLNDSIYNLTLPEGFFPNFILIKEVTIFKLYMIMGTSDSGVVPFGNDYLFNANPKGEIINWNKYHSRMIPAMAEYNGRKAIGASHSHLQKTPYITATDICTFRLYSQNTELEKFSVYSPAIDKTMTYILKTNKIKLEK